MEVVGICFDKQEIFKHQKRLETNIEKINKEAERIMKHRVFLSSTSDVKNVIYDELKLVDAVVSFFFLFRFLSFVLFKNEERQTHTHNSKNETRKENQ
jgi:hypothetical protein